MAGGYFKVPRAAAENGSDHWLAKYWREKRRFSEYEAVHDLTERAAFAPYEKRSKGFTVNIGRGQVLTSLSLCAARWNWPRSRVRRFLNGMENRSEIETLTETPLGTVYLLKHYEFDQSGETAVETASETAAEQRRNHYKKGKKVKKSLGENGVGPLPEIEDPLPPASPQCMPVLVGNTVPDSLVTAVAVKWGQVIGPVSTDQVRRELPRSLSSESTERPTIAAELIEAVSAFAAERRQDKAAFWHQWSFERFARELPEWRRRGAEPLVDEWGELTPRAIREGVSAA